MRLLTALLFGLIMLTPVIADVDLSNLDKDCVYQKGMLIFHCSNSRPGTNILPGETGVIEIRCCYTGDRFINQTEPLPITVRALRNWTRRVQQENLTWITYVDQYPGTEFIKNITTPSEAVAFEPFTISMYFELPEKSDYYAPRAVIPARIDVNVDTGGLSPTNAVFPEIVIPASWEPPFELPLDLIAYSIIIFIIVAVSYYVIMNRKRRREDEL